MYISRRVVLGASAASLLSSCMTCNEKLPILQNSVPIGDAHAHFFNASDLPIYGFIRYVAAKDSGSNTPVALGVANVLQTLADYLPISANSELNRVDRHTRSNKPPQLSVTQKQFAENFQTKLDQLVEEAIDRQAEKSDSFADFNIKGDDFDIQFATQDDNDKGVIALAFLLREEDNDKQDSDLFTLESNSEFNVQEIKLLLKTDREKIIKILNDEIVSEEKYFLTGFSLEQIWAYLRWGYLLMQSRCSLVGEYLKKIQTRESGARNFQPKVMINLMVDYDYWLTEEAKEPRSSHISQIAFWDKYSRSVGSHVDIHTFTGFDPLKLAVEKRLGIHETHFSKLQQLYNAKIDNRHSFSGFKFYPPMGFRPWNNSGLENTDFEGDNGIGTRIIDLWNSDWNGKETSLGMALDDALADAYDFCLEHDIPILAHASPSVLTAKNFSNRPNPKHWIDLITNSNRSKSGYEFSRLRLNLGHFTLAEDFINNRHPWSRQHIRELFKLSNDGNANVYADIGMMDELVVAYENGNFDLTYDFFDYLAKFCDTVDSKCERLMFGTDWIMLGHVVGHQNYLKIILDALNKNSWWTQSRKDNFLYLNLKRFLKLT